MELREHFEHVRLERQHTWIASAVLDDARFRRGGEEDLGAGIAVHKLEPDSPGGELDTLALASQHPLPDAVVVLELASRMELRDGTRRCTKSGDEQAQATALAARGARDAQLLAELATLRAQLVSVEHEPAAIPPLRTEIEELTALNRDLLQEVDELRREGYDLDELQAISERYTTTVESRSWTLTRPLREAGALLRRLRG